VRRLNALPKFAAKVPDSIKTPDKVHTGLLGEFEFFDGMPSKETVRKAYDFLDISRGADAFLNGIPAASVYAILEGIKDAGVNPGDLGIFEELMDSRSLYLTANSTTVYCMTEVNVTDGDLKATADGVKAGFRMYPLAKAANPPAQRFVNLSGKQMNTVHANEFSVYEELNAVIQYEPADAFDPELVGLFAAIGIKKGQPFEPDARMKKILTEAGAIGNATARAITFSPRRTRTATTSTAARPTR